VYPKHIRFICDRCAVCCSNTEDKVRLILLLKSETDRISKKTLIGLYGFAEKIQGFEPYIYQMKKTEEGKCIFLKDDLCSIYKIRPLICRFYPFQLKNLGNNRYVFAYTEECPGIGKGSQLKRRFFERLFGKFMELMRENTEASKTER